jgi:hypothetical protein
MPALAFPEMGSICSAADRLVGVPLWGANIIIYLVVLVVSMGFSKLGAGNVPALSVGPALGHGPRFRRYVGVTVRKSRQKTGMAGASITVMRSG